MLLTAGRPLCSIYLCSAFQQLYAKRFQVTDFTSSEQANLQRRESGVIVHSGRLIRLRSIGCITGDGEHGSRFIGGELAFAQHSKDRVQRIALAGGLHGEDWVLRIFVELDHDFRKRLHQHILRLPADLFEEKLQIVNPRAVEHAQRNIESLRRVHVRQRGQRQTTVGLNETCGVSYSYNGKNSSLLHFNNLFVKQGL